MVDAKTLQRIAELSALRLDDADRVLQELNEAVHHAATLSAVDTEGVEPYRGTLPKADCMAHGTVYQGLVHSELLAADPDDEGGSFPCL